MRSSGIPSIEIAIISSIFDSSNDSKTDVFDTTRKGKKYYTTKNRLFDTNHSIIQPVFTATKGAFCYEHNDRRGKETDPGAASSGGSADAGEGKVRKARTRRLIQEGAILEKVLPEVQAVELSELEGYLTGKLSGNAENAS